MKSVVEMHKGQAIPFLTFSSDTEWEDAHKCASRPGLTLMLGAHDGDVGTFVVVASHWVSEMLEMGYDLP